MSGKWGTLQTLAKNLQRRFGYTGAFFVEKTVNLCILIRLSNILQLHRDLYKYSEKAIGGRFKNTQNVIAENHADGTQRGIFTPLAPHETLGAIEEICESFNRVIDSCEVDSLILIPIFIHDFL